MENKERYITFALPMVRNIIVNAPNAITEIINYGVYRFAQTFNVQTEAAYRQIVIETRNRPYNIPRYLYDMVVEDFFDGKNPCEMEIFDNDKELNAELIRGFMKDNAEDKNEIVEWYKVSRVYDMLKLAGTDINIPDIIRDGRYCQASYGTGQVPVSVTTSTLLHMRDKIKTEYDRVKVAMYLGIRSLAGNGVAVTTAEAIKWRMMGARNEEELKDVLRKNKLNAIYQKWGSRYFYRMMLDDLISAKMIKQISYRRRTCVTASILDEAKFVEAVATKLRRIDMTAKRTAAQKEQVTLAAMLTDELNSS
jgi:hypothetical protein